MIATSKKFNDRFSMSKIFKPEAGSIPKNFKIFETVAFWPAPAPAKSGPPTNVCAIFVATFAALFTSLKIVSYSCLSKSDGIDDAASMILACNSLAFFSIFTALVRISSLS